MASTQTDLVSGLGSLGLTSGDVVFVHSSLSSFGHVEGGAETVVQAFLEVLGPEGTLAGPSFGKYFKEGSGQVWDRDGSPSLLNRTTSTFFSLLTLPFTTPMASFMSVL